MAIDQIDEMEGVDPHKIDEVKETQQREYNARVFGYAQNMVSEDDD